MTDQPIPQLAKVAGVRFQKVGKLYHFDFTAFPNLQVGDYVIVETMRGEQMGEVAAFYDSEPERMDYKPILRLATARDLLLRQQWEEKQLPALIEVRETAAHLGGYEQCRF